MGKTSERRKKEITPGSVMKAVIRPGGDSAHPQEGDQILFHCTTRTENGVVVDSTRSECGGHGFPKRLVLGKSKMIRGWEEGIPSMLKGEVAMLRIKSELHYGDENCPVEVPENFPVSEELLFEIELLDFFKVKIISDDLGVTKQVLIEGEGWETAREPYEVKAWITASTLDDQEILSFKGDKTLHFTFGKREVPEGLEKGIGTMTRKEKAIIYVNGSYLTAASTMPSLQNISEEVQFEVEIVQIIQVPEGLEMCIRLMLPNEIALVSSTPDYAYDKFPRPENVPEGANIQWEVELLKFETPKDWTGLNFTEIMDEAEKIKNTGNRLFKEGKYELAKAKYEKVLKDFNHVNPQDNDEGKIFVQTRGSLHLNVAACYQKIGEYKKALESCNKVLGENPGHVKALYRRGIAYMACGDFDEARKDFNMMIDIDKSSEPDATAALNKLRHKEQEVEELQRKQFKGLFDKKPGEISKEGSNDQEQQEASIQNSKDVAAEKSDELENHEPQESPHFQYQFAKQETLTSFWTHGRNILRRLGLTKCTIL